MEVDVEAVRAQVGRVVHSKTFETSEVHRHLLQYLADKTIAGEADRLKEYTVGLEAFGKASSYDPRHDSIVRLQIGRLRQKLLSYYQVEGSADQIVIGLPKGAFRLTFEHLQPNGRQHPGAYSRESHRTLLLLALALLGIWAVVATVSLVRARRDISFIAERWSPELETLWAPFLQSNRSLLVCLGTPMFIRFPAWGFFRDPKVNDWQELEKSESVTAARKLNNNKEPFPSYAFTGAGEASAAFLISKLLSTRKHELLLTRSNILSWQQVIDHDVIFLGPPKFNLQLQAAALSQDVVVEAEGIRNLKPRSGEPIFLQDRLQPGKASEGVTHALISRTPGLSGAGEFMVIAGNASPDSFAAAEWLTQPRRAKELVDHLRKPSGGIPRYFQVVLKVEFKQGIPVASSYVFHHDLDTSPPQPAAKK